MTVAKDLTGISCRAEWNTIRIAILICTRNEQQTVALLRDFTSNKKTLSTTLGGIPPNQ